MTQRQLDGARCDAAAAAAAAAAVAAARQSPQRAAASSGSTAHTVVGRAPGASPAAAEASATPAVGSQSAAADSQPGLDSAAAREALGPAASGPRPVAAAAGGPIQRDASAGALSDGVRSNGVLSFGDASDFGARRRLSLESQVCKQTSLARVYRPGYLGQTAILVAKATANQQHLTVTCRTLTHSCLHGTSSKMMNNTRVAQGGASGRRRSTDSQRSHLRVARYLSGKVGRLAHMLGGELLPLPPHS